MIKPTVGRVVWFYMPVDAHQPGFAKPDDGEPCAAIITRVWGDRMVNLTVFDANGVPHSRTSVSLLQEGDEVPSHPHATWMPYQVGQAKKHESEVAKSDPPKSDISAERASQALLADQSRRILIDRIARVCHEVNRAYCESMGDTSQPIWEDAPQWQRESARMGVDLHLMGEFGPEASHISWMQHKLDDGWVYGPVKDPVKKEHPCLVPFDQLPREQQAKDFIFRAVVHALR